MEGIYYGRACHMCYEIFEDLSYGKMYLSREHVLWEDMPYCRTCFMGTHVLWKDIAYRRTCFTEERLTGGHVLSWGVVTKLFYVRAYLM